MNHLPRTEIQQRLDADFDAMFGRAIASIDPPLSPEEMDEGDQAAGAPEAQGERVAVQARGEGGVGHDQSPGGVTASREGTRARAFSSPAPSDRTQGEH